MYLLWSMYLWCIVYVILPLFFLFVFQVKLYKQAIITQHGHRQSEQKWNSQDQNHHSLLQVGSLLTKVKISFLDHNLLSEITSKFGYYAARFAK